MALDIHLAGGFVLSVADELHIHPEPIEDVLEEIHLRGQSDEGVHTAFAAGDIDFVGYAGEVIARVGRVLRECHDCLAAEPEVCESLAELLNFGNSS